MYHGKKFYAAVGETNKNVKWVEYPDEGHGWRQPGNNYDSWTGTLARERRSSCNFLIRAACKGSAML